MKVVHFGFLVLYLIGAFVTFGIANDRSDCDRASNRKFESGVGNLPTREACFPPIVAAIGWPIYWSGMATIEVAK